MSIRLMSQVWESGLNRQQKSIALAYADHAEDDGTGIYPSLNRMEYNTSYTRRSVQTITKELVDLGVLVFVGQGYKSVNEYRMDESKLPKRMTFQEFVESKENAGGAKIAPVQKKTKGVQKKTQGVQKTVRRDAEIAPDPSNQRKDVIYKYKDSVFSFSSSETDLGLLAGDTNMSLSTAWKATMGEIELKMEKATFNTWLKNADLVAVVDNEFYVRCNNDYGADWLNNRLKDTVVRTLSAITGIDLTIVFVVEQIELEMEHV